MKAKSFVTGLIMGAVITTTISVTAENLKVETWLTDNVIINIDGKDKKLPQDVHILNYEEHVYLPFRYVVEEMGGKVDYNAKEKKVMISKPEPIIETVTVEVEKPIETTEEIAEEVPEETPEPTQTPSPSKNFEQAPVKLKIQNVTINVFGMGRGSEETTIFFDLKNENSDTIMLDHRKAYIEIDGTKYSANVINNLMWGSSIDAYKELENEQLQFDPIPKDVRKMEVVIPIAMDYYSPSLGRTSEIKEFRFLVDFTE